MANVDANALEYGKFQKQREQIKIEGKEKNRNRNGITNTHFRENRTATDTNKKQKKTPKKTHNVFECVMCGYLSPVPVEKRS